MEDYSNKTCEIFVTSGVNKSREWNENPTENTNLILLEGYILVSVALIGILGNLFTVSVILLQKEMRASIYCLLLGLAISDTLVVVSGIFVYGLPAFTDYYPAFWPFYRKRWAAFLMVNMHPILYVGQTASVFFVMAVTLERFLHVKFPIKARTWCSWRKARRVGIGIFIVSFLYNIPRWWEYAEQCVWWPEDQEFIYRIRFRLRDDPKYALIYINFMFLIFIQIIPFTSISVLNLIIYKEVCKANQIRSLLSKTERKEINLAKMFICIALIYLTCNLPFVVCNGHEGFMPDFQVSTLWYIGDLLVIVNSSVNFIIYCLFGKKFRDVFLRRLSTVLPGFSTYLQRKPSSGPPDITIYANRRSASKCDSNSLSRIGRYSDSGEIKPSGNVLN